MPLRYGSDDVQAAVSATEPITAARPSTGEREDEGSLRSDRRPQANKPERGLLVLKIIIGAVFIYAAVMGVGLIGMMFPRETHDLVRAINQALAYIRPEPQKTRTYVPPTAQTAVSPPPTAPAPVRKRVQVRKAATTTTSQFSYEIVDPVSKHHIAPKPPSASVTVSVEPPKTTGQATN